MGGTPQTVAAITKFIYYLECFTKFLCHENLELHGIMYKPAAPGQAEYLKQGLCMLIQVGYQTVLQYAMCLYLACAQNECSKDRDT